jgi:hypothetical protein
MLQTIFNYLLESSICTLFFIVFYRLVISNQTHFPWMRVYLLSSLMLSLVLPFIVIPVPWNISPLASAALDKTFLLLGNKPSGPVANAHLMTQIQHAGAIDWQMVIIYVLSIGYLVGLIYKAYHFFRNILKIQRCIKQSYKIKENNYWIVDLKDEMPAFTFLNYIFLNHNYKNIQSKDLKLIKHHEIIHVNQHHSLDILFVELFSIVFWFNPLVNYVKKSLQEIHEYIVDEKIVRHGEEKRAYAQLLLHLVTEAKVFNLSASFTGQQIKQRILMFTKPRTSPVYKLLFCLLIPLTFLLMMSFSIMKHPYTVDLSKPINKAQVIHKLTIGEITWQGNTAFGISVLNEKLGLKKGEKYNHDVSSRLENVQMLYLDSGYVFYKADFAESRKAKDLIDITITIYEGMRGKIGIIALKGNKTVSDEDIYKKLMVKTGEFFSKTKIINSIHALEAMGKFVPEKMNINVIPDQQPAADGFARVNIEFLLTEK